MAFNIADLFEHTVDAVPDRLCVVDRGREYTFAELDARGNRFGHHLQAAGVGPDRIEVFEIPGAVELPLAASYCAASGRFTGVACLGAVIRGETDHYDFVCREAARGIQNVQLETGVPCGFGVLTVENMDQALERTGGGVRDQGAAAARAVLAMARMRSRLGQE